MTRLPLNQFMPDVNRLYLARIEGGRGLIQLEVPAIPPEENEASTTYARKLKDKARHQGRQQLRSKWESKALHGKYPQRVKQADVDQDKTHRWLKAANLKAKTEGFIIAA